MAEIVTRAMADGARKAIAENDALGIDSVGTVDGKIVWRKARPPTPAPVDKQTGDGLGD